jgi:pre-rRNA-processing protein TSR3
MSIPRIVAFRHMREKRAKCSLMPVEGREGVYIRRAKPDLRYDGTGHILLAPGAPELSPADAFLTDFEVAAFEREGRADLITRDAGRRALRPVLLLDSVWRLLPGMRARIVGAPIERSLPTWIATAYPRASKMTDDPDCGLATIEALYAALLILGFDSPELLDGYRWREGFLAQFPRK